MIIPATQPANNTAFRLTGSSVYSEGAELVVADVTDAAALCNPG